MGEAVNLEEMLENHEFFLWGGVGLELVPESFDILLSLPPRGGIGRAGVDEATELALVVDATPSGGGAEEEVEVEGGAGAGAL